MANDLGSDATMAPNFTSVDDIAWFADPNRLALVSSLYAPGNVICWLLTVVACCITWTMNLKGRKADSIDSNLIAALGYMAVAGAHQATQLHGYAAHQPFGHFVEEPTLQKKVVAIEASARVLEMAMACCVLLFVVAVRFSRLKRALVVGVIGMFCLAAEIGFAVHFVAMFGIGCVVAVLLAYASLGFLPRSGSQDDMNREDDEGRRDTDGKLRSASLEYPVLLSVFVVPSGVLTVLFLTGYDFTKHLDEDLWTHAVMWEATHIVGDHLAHHIMPHTNTSVYDLDQAAALLAGMTVLGFSLYSAADSHYQMWRRTTKVEDTLLR